MPKQKKIDNRVSSEGSFFEIDGVRYLTQKSLINLDYIRTQKLKNGTWNSDEQAKYIKEVENIEKDIEFIKEYFRTKKNIENQYKKYKRYYEE